MAALARAAPCPRLWLRSTSSSRPSPTSPPHTTRGDNDAPVLRCYMRCYNVSSGGCTRATVAARPQSACPPPQQQQQRRTFRCTGALRSDLAKKNHYDRLQVSPAATPAEIKKSFYKLSKTHHPDANRNDPNAAQTFSLLSESYALLSDPSRRSKYDRDVMARLQPQPASASPHHGSYHSAAYSSPAGGRPASGLSKRRGTFRGPPPSFYRNGGWGAHSEKRRQAQDARGSDAFTAQQAPGGHFRREQDDVPLHFDKEGHRKTHAKEDQRRWARARAKKRALDEENVEFEPQTSLGAHFAIVLGILGATVLVPVWYLNTMSGKKKKEY